MLHPQQSAYAHVGHQLADEGLKLLTDRLGHECFPQLAAGTVKGYVYLSKETLFCRSRCARRGATRTTSWSCGGTPPATSTPPCPSCGLTASGPCPTPRPALAAMPCCSMTSRCGALLSTLPHYSECWSPERALHLLRTILPASPMCVHESALCGRGSLIL